MIRRRAATGLLLLCALVFCAAGASSASAAGITVFECEKGAAGESKYSDAHCDLTDASGEYGHVPTKSSNFDSKQVSKNFKLNTTLLTLATEITCTEQTSTGSIENLTGPPMKAKGTETLTFSSCTVNKPAKCVVKTPIIAKAALKSVLLNEGKGEYGLEYEPESAGGSFTELTFENKGAEKCGIANGGKAFPVKGSLIATGSAANMLGGVHRFNAAEAAMQKLTIGGEPATVAGETTFTEAVTKNALTLTIV